MTIDEAKQYYLARAREVQQISKDGTPWGFLCAACLLDSLAKLVAGQDKGRTGYKEFIRDYLSQINVQYISFTYLNGQTDLPDQMYHVLRCGIVHSYSLVPDQRAINNGGRIRSIVLCHKKESRRNNLPHLSLYSSQRINNSALFVSEDFANDLKKATTLIFRLAKKRQYSHLHRNILNWINKHPPICGGF